LAKLKAREVAGGTWISRGIAFQICTAALTESTTTYWCACWRLC